MAGSFKTNSTNSVRSVPKSMPAVRSFNDFPYFFSYPFSLSGITRDSTGTALGLCNVTLFRSFDDSVAGKTMSDPNGNWRMDVSDALSYYAVAYKVGLPDVAGTTIDTLQPSSPVFDTSVLSGCQLWVKSDSLATTYNDGDLIASWSDSSGSGNTLTQSTEAFKPVYKANAVNGWPSVMIPDTGAFMNCSAPAEQKPVTFFAVIYNSITGSSQRWILTATGLTGVNFLLDYDFTSSYAISLRKGVSTLIAKGRYEMVADTWYVVEATYSATGDYAFYVNGTSNIDAGTNDVSVSATTRTLSFNGIGSVSPYITEVMQFDTVLPAAKRSLIRSYLGRKYAISVQL